MAKLLKLRRGTTTQHGSFTGAEGEVTIDTTKDTAVVHDGSQAGGRPLAREDLSNVSSSTIAGRLDNDSITPAKIGAGTLPSDVTVASANLVDGTIVNADINASAAIANSKLADSGVSAGTVGSSTAIPVVTVNSKGIITNTSTTAVDSTTIANGSASVAVSSNGPITSNANHDFSAGIDVTGNITATGTIDGRDVAADGTKLDGIESSATADQTAAEIRTLVESASDSNVFTDADHTKLNGIEASATADQSDAEIRAAVEAASDSNVFTDADHSKLNGIAASANNYTHPNHSGEVTSSADGATTIASNVVDEDNLKVSNSPTNGYFLSAQSGNTGGMTWAEVNLSALSASNLTSGTIPDARFPSTLPAINGSNLTGLAAFPSGTKMIFNQASAPTGWTKETSNVDNKALRVVSGSGGGTGGSVGFTTAFGSKSISATASSENTGGSVASHTLTENEIPSHNHALRMFRHQSSPNLGYAAGWQGLTWYARSFQGAYQDASVTSTGGGAGHTHGFTGGAHNHTISVSNVDLSVSYIDVIVASKD
tara:strand:+ start:2602 stop:4230 length:1629 start_codon:yes stop_codon:yes gene_type:complete